MAFRHPAACEELIIAKIQNVALSRHPACHTLVLDNAPILVRLAVLLSLGLPQKHDPADLAITRSVAGNRVGLHYSRFQSSAQKIWHRYQMLTRRRIVKKGPSEGRIREDGLAAAAV